MRDDATLKIEIEATPARSHAEYTLRSASAAPPRSSTTDLAAA